MAKAPYGSAATKDCEKCKKPISRTNFSKHERRCKGIKVRDSRSEICKCSWVNHRAKRVGDQRTRRAAHHYKKLEALRTQLQELKSAPLPPRAQPAGLKRHPLKELSLNADLFEFIFYQVEDKELLSTIWLKKAYLLLHPDKRHHLPQQFKGEDVTALLQDACKMFSAYKYEIEEASTNIIFEERVRLEKYRSYLQNKYKKNVDEWRKQCAKILADNSVLQDPIQKQIDSFGEAKDCTTLAEFEAAYKVRFVEKDQAYKTKLNEEVEQRVVERRFREAFGTDSENEDE